LGSILRDGNPAPNPVTLKYIETALAIDKDISLKGWDSTNDASMGHADAVSIMSRFDVSPFKISLFLGINDT
jgi:hypothetical protein